MADTCIENAPDAAYKSQETISVCTLDDSVMASLRPEDSVWLKIDTQGFEAEVLKGALRLIPRVRALECELSLVPLYDGQPLVDEMIAMIYQTGFRMVGVASVFSEKETEYVFRLIGAF